MGATFQFKRTLTLDTAAKAVNVEFKSFVRDLHNEFQNTLASPVFAWDSVTKRRNGDVVGDPRDAIDLGGLLDSQTYKFISNKTAVIEWEAPYSPIVFDHATTDLVAFTLARLKR